VRYLYNKKRGFRSSEGERFQFAFFVVGAIVLLAVAFVIGLQVGRVVEKNAEQRRIEANKVEGRIVIGKEAESEIRKDLGVFSEEAGSVPPVPPPSAGEHLNETEKSLTFRETLAKKDPDPILLVRPSPTKKEPERNTAAKIAPKGTLMVQVAAFRDRAAAEAFRKRLQKSGFQADMTRGGGYHKVVVGPYPDREAANRAIRKLKSEWKVNPFLVRR
jgi:cell division protein FtsN